MSMTLAKHLFEEVELRRHQSKHVKCEEIDEYVQYKFYGHHGLSMSTAVVELTDTNDPRATRQWHNQRLFSTKINEVKQPHHLVEIYRRMYD